MDWKDIAIHAGAAGFATGLIIAAGVPHWIAIGLNALFWFGREWLQKPNHGRVWSHPQSLMEWLAPAFSGFAVAAVWP